MKKSFSALWIFLSVLIAVVVIGYLGERAMQQPQHDDQRIKMGALLSHLRDGQRFALADAYPQKWDVAQFATSYNEIARYDQRLLFAYDKRFAIAQKAEPIMLLWNDNELVFAITLPTDKEGYPRFLDAMGSAVFQLTRREAVFLCGFITDESARTGYYRLTAEGQSI